ncbi:hypothetical protein A3I95_00485 [Candidatus Nomurabacteria bacterium RIFCSPLOWO2_02_FULL_44_12]|uniref:Uncharacterized protein n=1 Tax=Candidatus Nomurabacteria bacterium RIFCSPLOWO2_12_FULL_44_11 TaxID=1801796 RepID=A0A1F6Y6K5_9BACT|nr:MAG: hypothetical protein A3E95_02805 [Candidatus Nomurabacteria bacterium RIFCSPHIGHO2_12_FULL_44_22b]OGJ01997.1 MAG: hypothetical protein A3G53_01790 [Candidatus Nomurabacteria bacterium RIFCSPLOWO2_12_FULL_44_11]OGJ08748.1 MAG: hypothetical protein A3I95_00485 [Candidatus Nomurabacteria bacterium RIFCSPLOWO2_02_FULL_44_12]
MIEKLKQTIKDEIAKLPKEIQEVINTYDWVKMVEEIGKKYSLNEDKIESLQVETLLVLTGLEEGNYFAQNLERNVGITKGDATSLVREIEEKIFAPIYQTLMENIKSKMKDKNPTWEQTVNFILSGGNYAVFVVPTRVGIPTEVEKTRNGMINTIPPRPDKGEVGRGF